MILNLHTLKFPKNFEFQNSNHIQPLDGENLAKEIKKIIFILQGQSTNLQGIIISKGNVWHPFLSIIAVEFLNIAWIWNYF